MSKFLLVLMAFLPAATQAEVYRWTDAQGRIRYSDLDRQRKF